MTFGGQGKRPNHQDNRLMNLILNRCFRFLITTGWAVLSCTHVILNNSKIVPFDNRRGGTPTEAYSCTAESQRWTCLLNEMNVKRIIEEAEFMEPPQSKQVENVVSSSVAHARLFSPVSFTWSCSLANLTEKCNRLDRSSECQHNRCWIRNPHFK